MKTEADYTLPERFIKSVAGMDEFRPGGSILSVKLKNGEVISGLCVSTCKWFIGHATLKDIPFDIADIEEVFQTPEQKEAGTPASGWVFWQTGCKAASLTRFIKKD